jgi:hypothetical protein
MAVWHAIKQGVLIRPDACKQCGKVCKPDAAHFDYARPLDVRWLCRSCHVRWDRAEPKGGVTPGTFSVRFPGPVYRAVVKEAEREHRSISAQLLWIVERHLSRHKRVDPEGEQEGRA